MNLVETMNDSNVMAAQRQPEAGLKPYLKLDTGTILTLRMRGHTRTQGQEYYAPAVVLNQYHPDGQIDAVIFDSTSSVSVANAYSIRDIGVEGDGPQRRMVELRSNIGEILFSPAQQRDMQFAISELQQLFLVLDSNRINGNKQTNDNYRDALAHIDVLTSRIEKLERSWADLNSPAGVPPTPTTSKEKK